MFINALISKSIRDQDPEFINRFSLEVLNETYQEIFAYLIDYQERYSTLPDEAAFKASKHNTIWTTKYSGSSLQWLFDQACEEAINEFFVHVYADFEATDFKDYHVITNASEIAERASNGIVKNIDGLDASPFARMYGTGLQSGIPFYDEAIGGFFPGKYNIFFAPLGSAKTYLMNYIVAYQLLMGKKVLVVRGEMTEDEYIARIAGICLGWNSDAMIREASRDLTVAKQLDESVNTFLAYVKQIGGDIFFTSKALPYVSQIKAAYKQCLPDLVVIDGIYMLPKKGKVNQNWEKEANVSTEIRDWCKGGVKVKNVVYYPRVVATTQMNREGIKQGDPNITHIGGSIQLGQDADNVFAVMKTSFTEFMVKQVKGRGNRSFKGAMYIDWDTMKFGYECNDFSYANVEDAIATLTKFDPKLLT